MSSTTPAAADAAALPLTMPAGAPPAFHVLAKPTGAICNLDCSYCFFLSKESLYPGSAFRMADDVLETYIRQLIEAHRAPEVAISWQGGEPTLMGLEFFRRAMKLVEQCRRPGMRFLHTIQTNGTLIDEEWAAFFKEHDFLVGISIDGPAELHDAYRVDKGGAPTFSKVMRGLRLMQAHRVEYNVLATVNRITASRPLDVYRFLRDEAGATWLQFIPVVERINDDGGTLYQQGARVSDRSVLPEQLGAFLCEVFDEWVRRDVGRVFVQTFEAAARSWVGMGSSGMCVFDETCGLGLALEHNGDLYSCDHFVEPAYLLGNIRREHMIELVSSERQQQFGRHKRESLPRYCVECDVRFACHGECPKNRFMPAPDGEAGLNYLCAGLKSFFHHIDGPMQAIASLVRAGQPADGVMRIVAEQDDRLRQAVARAARNDACPCGSGARVKRCHGATVAGVAPDRVKS